MKNLLPGKGEEYLGDAEEQHQKRDGGQKQKKGRSGGEHGDLIPLQKAGDVDDEPAAGPQTDDGGVGCFWHNRTGRTFL